MVVPDSLGDRSRRWELVRGGRWPGALESLGDLALACSHSLRETGDRRRVRLDKLLSPFGAAISDPGKGGEGSSGVLAAMQSDSVRIKRARRSVDGN